MKSTIRTLILILLVAISAVAQTRDRRLVGLKFVRAASNTGRVDVYAQLRVLTGDPAGVNMNFGLQLFRGEPGALGNQVGGNTQVPMQTTDQTPCEQENAYVDCSNGFCQSIICDGVLVPGVCTSIELDQMGGYSIFECVCIHECEVKIGDEVRCKPGDKFTARIVFPPTGSAPDNPGFPTSNNEISVTVGSRADEPGFMFPGRQWTPMNGQGNSTQASLTQSLTPQGVGPIEYWGEPGTNVTLTHAGNSGMPRTLILGPPTLDAFPWLPDISVDVLPFAPGACAIYDQLFNLQCSWNLPVPPPPSHQMTWTLPGAFPGGGTASLQGFVADPTSANGIRATARNTIGLQSMPLNAPDLPPHSGTLPFPIGRDAVVPNHGPTASAAGVSDGTLHSVIGTGFDAVNPGNTSVMVNGIAADVVLVRPNEILFRLRPAHRGLIGGPIEVTSTGGANTPIPDQMEEWVFATPPVTEMKAETTTPMGSLRGSFALQGGLKGATGLLPSGDQHVWKMASLVNGTQVRAFAGQLAADGQLVVRCVTTATGAICYPNAAIQPWSQMLSSPAGVEDLRLRHGDHQTSMFFGLPQQDGGPGSSPFAGQPGVPGAATVSGDPDGAFVTAGGHDMVEISGSNVGGPGPFRYLLLVSWP